MKRGHNVVNTETALSALVCDLPLFVEAARAGSFSRAAERLDMNIATLSRRIAKLEEKIGVPLFSRSTRHMELTTGGRILLARGEFIVSEMASSLEAVTRHMNSPSGPVRVSIQEEEIYHTFLLHVFSAVSAKWPDITLNVSFFEHRSEDIDPVHDIMIRSGPLTDSSLVARKVFVITLGLYAAPSLLKKYTAPGKPEDVLAMPCIRLARSGGAWVLNDGARTAPLPVRPAFQSSSISLCNEFALSGRGVAMLRRDFAEPHVRSGALVRLLPEWSGPSHDYYLLRTPGQIPKRVRLVFDHLIAHFEKANKDVF